MKKLLLAFAVFIMPFFVSAQCNTNVANSCSCKDGSTNCDLLPDIIVGRPPLLTIGNSGYIEYPQNCNGGCSGNDRRLRISVSSPNVGYGPLEVRALLKGICGTDTLDSLPAGFICPNGDPVKQLIKQRVYHKNGNTMTYYDRPAGSMTYHPSHNHMHVDDWGIYTLRTATADPNPLNWPIIGTGSKLAFCLMDYGTCSTYNGHCRDSLGNVLTNGNFPNMGLGGGGFNCNPSVQGISSGYTDIYYQYLDGMWINLPVGLCNGQYWVVVELDPKGYFLESNENNNTMAIPITLTKQNGVDPTITPNGPTTFCAGGSVTLSCSAAQNYLWSNGATTSSIVVNQSGNYTVSINSGTACPTISQPIQVTVNPVNITTSAIPSSICSGQTSQISASVVSSGSITQSIAFTNSTSYAIPDNNPAGASSVINISGLSPATLSFNSIVSVKINIAHNYLSDLIVQLIAPSGNAINLSNSRGGSGKNYTNTIFSASATTAIGNGTAPFTGTYRPEAAFSALTGNLNGNWTLKVIDQAGNTAGTINNWTITVNRSVPTVLSYAWTSNPAGFTSPNAITSVSPTTTTTYTVNVNESGTGCAGSKTVTVAVGNNLNVTTNTPNAICAGQNTTLTATGASTYLWSPATGLNSTTGESVIANPSQTTNYMVIGSNGGCSDTAYVTVNVTALPLVSANTPSTICAGESTILTASGATTYNWSPSTGLDVTVGSSVTASPTQTTTYQLTGTTDGCSATIPVEVIVNPIPVVNISGNTTICSGTSTTLTPSGADNYSWDPITGLNIISGGIAEASPLTTTTYTVTGTSNNCSSTASITINVNNKPEAPLTIIGTDVFCLPMNAAYSIDPVINATSYTWSSTPAGINILTGQGSTSITAGTSLAGNYSLCVTADNECGSSLPACLNIHTYSNSPGAIIKITGSLNKVCPGDLVTYSIDPLADALYYTWSVPAGADIQSGQNSTSITVQINPGFVGGNMTVKAKNTCGVGPIKYKAIQLNNPATPSAITGANYGVCLNTYTYSVTQVSGLTYNWTAPTGSTILSGQNTNSVSIQFNQGFISGNISVTAQNNCGISSARTKLINAVPKQEASISGPISVCTGQSGVAFSTASLFGATSYLWSITNGSTVASGQGTSSVSVNFGTLARTVYLKVSGVNACGTGLSKALTIAINTCAKINDFNNNGMTLNLHPNPAKEYVEVIFNTEYSSAGELNITNILGQSQYKQMLHPDKGENSFMVDLRKLPAGVYILSILQEGRTHTQRLIVE